MRQVRSSSRQSASGVHHTDGGERGTGATSYSSCNMGYRAMYRCIPYVYLAKTISGTSSYWHASLLADKSYIQGASKQDSRLA